MPILIDTFFATASTYEELHAALRLRAERMNVSREAIDAVSGMPTGYTGTLLAPARGKRLGKTSTPLLLRSLGLKLIVVDDPEAVAVMAKRYEQRTAFNARAGNKNNRRRRGRAKARRRSGKVGERKSPRNLGH